MAANAAFPTAIAGNVVTNTVDGITWRYLVDEANKQIRMLSTSGTDLGPIVSSATAGTVYVPATLVHTNGACSHAPYFRGWGQLSSRTWDTLIVCVHDNKFSPKVR